MSDNEVMKTCLEHSAHERAIRKHDEQILSMQGQIGSINECLIRLTTLQEEYAKHQRINNERITELENVPKTRWNSVVATCLTAFVSAIIGVIIATTGLHV